ncbi:MAG TPA: tetratricopeptide repeat protein, partial [Candidatus Kapabacteria bacterium]|nr:tetratricopeptide repeat protein [Candidatus Kapabacteria bacterium]
MQQTPATEFQDFDKLWDYSHPDVTEQKFRDVLSRTQKDADLAYYTQLLTQLARTLGLQRKFTEAHAVLDEVQPLVHDVFNDKLDVSRVRYLLERGRTYNSSGEKEKAKPLFTEAWNLAKTVRADSHAVDAAHMIAITETPDEALKWNERAIEYAEQSESPLAKNWLGSLYNNLGWTYHDKGEYAKALNCFERDLAWFNERDKEKEAFIAKWAIARVHRSLGNAQEAFDRQQDLLKEIAEKKIEQDGYVFEELGENALLLKKPEEETRNYFRQAYEMLSQDKSLGAPEAARLE